LIIWKMRVDLGAEHTVDPIDHDRSVDARLQYKAEEERVARESAAKQMKKGGKVSSTKGSKASSASKRADGIAQRGKTRGRIV
jgi:hypothetical protein